MSGPLRASVVVPSYRSVATIRACLNGVLAQEVAEPFEVIVVDSGDDGTADLVQREYPQVRLLRSAGRLDAALARNRGAREARGPVLAFIDSDCVPEQDWLQRLCHAIEDGRCDGLGGAIRPFDGSNSASWAGYFCEFREFMPGGLAADATYLTPGNVAYRRDVFVRAGGFPEGYFPLEDQVFYSRLHSAGARTRFDPSIVVAHAHRSEIGTFLAHQTKIGAADSLVIRVLKRPGAWIAARPMLALTLLPALATYRFARTVAACWKHEHYLLLRRPGIAGLCWMGMFAWGLGFARPARREAAFGSLAIE